MKGHKFYFLLSIVILLSLLGTNAQNPIIHNQFSADPTARVFNGKVYLYPSHDILVPEGKNLKKDWFCMEDYHVFSSENLTHWTDHGVIVTQTKVPWLVKPNYDMWAPDCVFKNGKYYFYFPVGGKIGVATSDTPEGPFTVQENPVSGIGGIDPCILMDKDGQAYIFTARGRLSVAKLKDNMVEVDGDVQTIANLPTKGLIEGPFAFQLKDKYYLTYPHVENSIERLEYAMSDSPMGPYKPVGVIMDESTSGCWTNHQSIVQYEEQWYLFYHDKDYSPNFDKNRSVRIDSLFFNANGTIMKVIPTHRGVGLTLAKEDIQLDRYSHLCKMGATIALLDSANTFAGWKTILAPNAWVQYNSVKFNKLSSKKVVVKSQSLSGGTLEIRLDKTDSPVVASIKIPKGSGWQIIESDVKTIKSGNHNLVVSFKGSGSVELDWIKFK